jgi:hypothetical protein
MKPLRRNGLNQRSTAEGKVKGHQHLAQGIALGRKTNIILYLSSILPLQFIYLIPTVHQSVHTNRIGLFLIQE